MIFRFGLAIFCVALFAIGDMSYAKPSNGHKPGTIVAPVTSGTSATSIYAKWANGPSQSPQFFPISVFWQSPTTVGQFGPYNNVAAAAAGEGINIFLANGPGPGLPWPEQFGKDQGELEAIKANNLYLIAGTAVPSTENTSAGSVASMLTLANSIGASANLIGYVAGDEPQCVVPVNDVPSVVQGINSYDHTRMVTYNQTAWMLAPQFNGCLSASINALDLTGVASFDLYPLVNPWVSHAQNNLFLQGMAVKALSHFSSPGQPRWAFVETGGDMFGFSETNNSTSGAVSSGSSTLTLVNGGSNFTAAWLGLTVSGAGIPANTTITQIIDSTHALMSQMATSTNADEAITITGGANNSDCVATYNICVAQGNEYRATPTEVNAEVWMSIINGANGIEYFCHDLTSYAFCLGDSAGGPAALAVQANLTYIDQTILSFAPVLNAPTTGICSMDNEDYTTGAWTTSSTCSNGVVTLTTSNPTLPGAVMVKQLGTATYVFVQSSRHSPSGAMFTFQLTGLGQKTATIVYDSIGHYQNTNASLNQTVTLNSAGSFSDTLGANGNDYQVKIYQIQ